MTTPQILVVDDEADIRTLIDEILSEEGYQVATAADGAEARERFVSDQPNLVLLDVWMPDVDGITLLKEWSREGGPSCPVVVMSGHGTVETAVEATRLGAVDFVEKPLSLQKLLRTVEHALQGGAVAPAARGGLLPSGDEPLGKSPLIRELRERAREVASHPAPLVIAGEAGSGREIIARLVHAAGDRGAEAFVRVSGTAIPAENAAQLLLGAETPTGPEPGLFEQAGNGVLFIADLQALCPEAQRLLLGAVEQGSFTRLGHAQATHLGCRIVASLRSDARQDPDAFGLDPQLLAAVSVLQLDVPPLREHPEDISDLLRRYVDLYVDAESLPYRHFGVAAQNRLRNYPWPGNIGELKRLVHRLLMAQGDEEIALEELEAALGHPSAEAGEPLVKQDLLSLPLREAREQFERAYLTQQLKLCGGKVGQLAKRVGMERTHLYRKLRSLGVDFRQVGDD
ncbi:MAG: sigma-54-dependent Fis family transcriptional regulator [Chromatiales bacterium]|nr:MAG: sigma-54-dependent Fis family transcriptional regulator [Chromatiales bacterium]